MSKVENIIVRINKWVLILLLTAMAVIVLANVSLRYLTNFSIIWAEEVARYIMIWMTFLGAGLVLRSGGHVVVTLVQDTLPRGGAVLLRLIIAIVLLIFFVVMITSGIEYMFRMGRQLTPATRIPFSYIYAAMPIGFGLMVLHLLFILKRFVIGDTSVDEGGQEIEQASVG